MVPERMIVGQGLGVKDVQHGGGQMAIIQGLEQILVDHVAAAGGVDDDGATGQAGKGIGVDDGFRLRRQRQQADEDFRSFQERLQAVGSVKAGDAIQVLGRAAPPGDVDFQPPQLRCRVGAEDAEAHDPDPSFADIGLGKLPPAFLGDQSLVFAEMAVVVEHPVDHVFAHAPDQPRVDQPHHRHALGQIAADHQVIDPGAQGKDRLQVGEFPQRPLLRRPHEGVFDVRRIAPVCAPFAAGGPVAEVQVRQLIGQGVAPQVRIVGLRGEQEGHGP